MSFSVVDANNDVIIGLDTLKKLNVSLIYLLIQCIIDLAHNKIIFGNGKEALFLTEKEKDEILSIIHK